MEITFRTKEEANIEQEKEFFSLTPVERFYRFLELQQQVNRFPTKAVEKKNNFLIVIKSKNGTVEEGH